jgi:riboflavin biosynthesis pyrimidine reductase
MNKVTSETTRDIWREKFEAYAARKKEAAIKALIPGYRTVEDRSANFNLARLMGNNWTRDLYDGDFYLSQVDDRHSHVLNTVFVQTLDGNTGENDPSKLGGGETDKHLIYEGLSRVAAHGVMAGANTIRGSGVLLSVWHPKLVSLRESLGLPRHPAQIIVTESGNIDLDTELMFNVPEVSVIVLTSNKGASKLRPQVSQRPWVTIGNVGETTDLPSLLRWMAREHGHERLSVIGGRTLTTGLIDSGLVRDLYLTTSNIHGGEPNTPYYTGSNHPPMDLVVRKEGLGEESGVVFEHFIIRR